MKAVRFAVAVAAMAVLVSPAGAAPSADGGAAGFATCRVENVYDGGARVPRGMVSSLRIVALRGERGEGGVESLGVVPASPRGAAHFRVPADVSVSLQALDRSGLAILTMREPIRLKKGEVADLAGLRGIAGGGGAAAKAGQPGGAAARMPVSDPSPEQGVGHSGPFSFERSVQPIFDRKCVSCHGLGKTDRSAFSLVGTNAVPNLVGRRQVAFAQGGGGARGLLRPYERSAAASPLWHLVGHGHGGVKLAADELRTLALWLDLGACLPAPQGVRP